MCPRYFPHLVSLSLYSPTGFEMGSGNGSGSGNSSQENDTNLMPANDDVMATNTSDDIRSTSIALSRIELPVEVFADSSNETDFRIFFSAYQTPTLFPVAPESREEGFEVATSVIGASITGMEVSGLSDPVIITLQTTIQVKLGTTPIHFLLYTHSNTV